MLNIINSINALLRHARKYVVRFTDKLSLVSIRART